MGSASIVASLPSGCAVLRSPEIVRPLLELSIAVTPSTTAQSFLLAVETSHDQEGRPSSFMVKTIPSAGLLVAFLGTPPYHSLIRDLLSSTVASAQCRSLTAILTSLVARAEHPHLRPQTQKTRRGVMAPSRRTRSQLES